MIAKEQQRLPLVCLRQPLLLFVFWLEVGEGCVRT